MARRKKRVSESARLRRGIKTKNAFIREFTGKSGKSYLGIWFRDRSFALFAKEWTEDPFSHRFELIYNSKRLLIRELEIEIPEEKYRKLSTYQVAEMVLSGELKSKRVPSIKFSQQK
ncbi:MAG: hypothetical protein B6D65_00100 [candidate division Zixibacteria bacterium 4484_93]|nr:MAG: hypothetical protein B6D65_00100 [candidate division Zixibacteria bacterium 4484_93]